ncbi:MAG: hypothetical protein HC934_08105 [Acaryochloridaceae cyanobacterium SU_2_1]|nr:hypothetical protein [Acaryochloridaceae cyanobacterium SU_2_1]NJM95228.1 hypothetical protein [Acaryochloridaceae cyanobacterium CSU_5_19]
MTNPLTRAFFLGRATAEVLYEELEHQLTDVLSHLGQFDAEQREGLRQFTNQVMERAQSAAVQTQEARPRSSADASTTPDLQETIDELRAEIAQLRSTLQNYRSHSN